MKRLTNLEKLINTIRSCKTLEQIETSERLIELFIDQHDCVESLNLVLSNQKAILGIPNTKINSYKFESENKKESNPLWSILFSFLILFIFLYFTFKILQP